MESQPAVTVRAPDGMVCAVDHQAAAAGLAMLRAGGSAADAAVATSAVLAVTTQHMCGMGGDLLAVVADPGADPIALNSSGRAGSGADPDRLRADGHTVMPPKDDIRAVTVPGCVDGWIALHHRYGVLPLADVLEPARRYAAEGFCASPTLAQSVFQVAHLPEAVDYTAGGQLRAGSVVRRPGVARALSAIIDGGRQAFYEGEFGAGLLDAGRGEYTADDLARPLAEWVPALSAEAWGKVIWTVPPNSQGYLTLSGAWIADGLDLPADPEDPRWPHLLVEAACQSAYDRLDVLYDGADGEALLNPARLQARRDAIDPAWAATRRAPAGAGDTIALVAVDRNRQGVCIVQSNASGWGAHIAVPGSRIFLHDRGVGFSLEPGHPAEYKAGQRPPHTLCPTCVTNLDGSLAGVIGTMGGDGQPQILLQILARWLVGEQSPGPAVSAGRWVMAGGASGFDTWRDPGSASVLIEGHAPAGWADGLRERGHQVAMDAAFSHSMGHAHLITVEGDHLAGGTDPRPRFGAAAGL